MAEAGVARTFLGGLGAVALRRRLPFVLCYHGIGDLAHDPHGLFVTRADFEEQVDTLRDAGYRLVTARELWETVERGGVRAARGLGALTFDDGLAETLRTAGDVLASRDATATAYICSGLLGREHPDIPQLRVLTEDELRALPATGMEIGAHSSTHPDLATLSGEALHAEVGGSRERLEEILGAPVAGLAYPYGSYSPQTVRAAREAGFSYACACSGAGPWRPFEVPREPIFPSTSRLRLRIKVAGLYGPVHALKSRRDSGATPV